MKIDSLLETVTPSSTPDGNNPSSAPKFGRNPDVLEDDKLDEMSAGATGSGSVASVSQPLGAIGKRAQGSLFKGIKTSKKFPNSEPVKEEEIKEQDLIINPTMKKGPKHGFHKKDLLRQDHEVEMARSDLVSANKNSKKIYELIKNLSEQDGLDGWVQEKIIKANDYLNAVREYLENKEIDSNRKLKEMVIGEGMSTQELADAIYQKLESRFPDVVTRYGHEVVGDAVLSVADFHINSDKSVPNDLSIMVREVMRQLNSLRNTNESSNLKETKKLSTREKFNRSLKRAGYDPEAGAKRLLDLIAKQKKEREEFEKKYAGAYGDQKDNKDVAEAKWRDPKYKDKLYTQADDDDGSSADYDYYYYDNPRPEGKPFAGRKEIVGTNKWDHDGDILDRGIGTGNTGGGQWRGKTSPSPYKDSEVTKQGPRKGLLKKGAISKTKNDIRNRMSHYKTKSNLPEEQGVAEGWKGKLGAAATAAALSAGPHAKAVSVYPAMIVPHTASAAKKDQEKQEQEKKKKEQEKKQQTKEGVAEGTGRSFLEIVDDFLVDYSGKQSGDSYTWSDGKKVIEVEMDPGDSGTVYWALGIAGRTGKTNWVESSSDNPKDALRVVKNFAKHPLAEGMGLRNLRNTLSGIPKTRYAQDQAAQSAGRRPTPQEFARRKQAEKDKKKDVEEAAGLYGPFTVTINTGERPKSRTKTKKFRREDDAILWAEDWFEDFPQYVYATAEITDPEGNVVWYSDETMSSGKTVAEGVTSDQSVEQIEENLRKWFKEKWVRFGPDGKIKGDCARGDDSEGKPKCLPQSKAHSLGKKGRASAASRKRREDPNPERSGKAINVATKKKTNEEQLDELKCWPGYHRVKGTKAGAPGSCAKNESVAEGKEDLSKYSTERLKAYVEKVSGGGVPAFGSGAQLKRVQAELKRREQGVAEGAGRSFLELVDDFLVDYTGSQSGDAYSWTDGKKVIEVEMDPADSGTVYWALGIAGRAGKTNWVESGSDGARDALRVVKNFAKNALPEGVEEGHEMCPECGGAMYSEEMINEKKDACYYKVKSRYKVWPSAYASGALVKCRKKGAKNWGNKSK